MFADIDDVGILLDDVGKCDCGSYQIILDSQFMGSLKNTGIDRNVLFNGVFAYTLSRFIGSENILFKTVLNENNSMLLVNCKNQDASSFMNYVADLIENVSKYDCPFEEIESEYDAKSNIMFQYSPDNNPITDLSFDFNVNVSLEDKNYILNIIYSEKYSEFMVKRFAQSYNLILSQILNVNDLSDINYTTLSDLEFLDTYNQNDYNLKYDDILEAFNDNLAKYPDNKLVLYNDAVYSYAESAFIADKIAKKLANLGVESQDNVAFLVNRSELYLFNVLAILSMGAVYVPLDTNLPDERIEFILEDTNSKVLIVSDETYEYAQNMDNDYVLLNVSDIVGKETGTLSTLPVNYGDVACILYTSGTTGVPKGVKITRKSILNVAEWYVEEYDFGKDDVYGMFSSIGFDVASFNITVVMLAGACLAIVPDDCKSDMTKLNEYYIQHGVNHAWITTSVGKLFMHSVDITSLDILICGGEKLGDFESPKDYTLIDVCGPTEAFEHVYSIKNSDKMDSSSIGYLNYNTKAYLLDDEFRRVPVGAVGELYLAGYQLAEGYLNRDEKTREAFLDNPFDDDEEYNVLYRTGDMGRMLPDGSFAIVGRRDSQVKVRGNRVELSEIESVIRRMDGILDVTVQTIMTQCTNEIVVYAVSDMDENLLDESIRDYVAEHKPAYMVPSFVIKLDEIPLNVNGKVDRRALPDIDLDSLHVGYVAATNETEQIIVDAFEKVFNQEKISLYDDFVYLGGDSLIAIRVISYLQDNNISCAARDILSYKSPYLIAQHVKNIENVSYDSVEGAVDLFPMQSYFFDEINIDNFTQDFILKVTQDLDVDILQKAIDELTNIHDMLRVVYKFDCDEPVQEILPINTRVCEIKEYTISEDFDQNMRDIFIKSCESLDMTSKLMVVNMIHYNDECYLSIILHHLIVDGVSWNILLTDLTYLYFRINAGKEIEIQRPYPYKNWVEDVKNLVEDISDEEKQHWIKVNSLLDDSSIRGKTRVFAFNTERNYDLDNLLMLSEDEVLGLAIARAYKKTYDEDVIFNRESYGRDESIANLSRTVGWFTSQFPVHVKVNNGHDNISLMEDVYALKKALKDVNHLGLNYGSLVYTKNELEFKHCPVTFNFLSTEFVFKNELFESVDHYLSEVDDINVDVNDYESWGITFNISRLDNSYVISGDYAIDTYIGDKFDEFVENIKSEIDFITNYSFKDGAIVSCLSEAQLGIYLDEKVHEKSTAYSTMRIYECGLDKSVDEIKDAINSLIDKHPILKGRVVDGEVPLLVCDADPLIEIVDDAKPSSLVRPFDLRESLARFYIRDNDGNKSIIYDLHHVINDATSCTVIDDELTSIFEGNFDDSIDLGFVYTSRDSFDSKFDNIYDEAHEFYKTNLSGLDKFDKILPDNSGINNAIYLPIHGVRDDVENFCRKLGITVGNFLNSVFAYTYSRFSGSNEVFFTFTEHGRHETYNQRSLGMYVNTIPIIVDCSSVSVSDYLLYVSDLVLNSMKYDVYPFRLLASEFDLQNDVSFEYNFDLNDVSEVGDELMFDNHNQGLVSDFSGVVNDLPDGYVIGVESSAAYSDEIVIRFLNVFKEILSQITDVESLSDIEYISSEDLLLLDAINQTENPLDYDDILDAFNDNLSKYPDNKLVAYKDVSYTYSEGAFIADKISKQLIDFGVGTEDCVAFLTERSELYMFAVLGILSAGAVFVPLDDAHPDERIEFILKDTESRVVIVSDETYERVNSLTDDAILLNISDIIEEGVGNLSSLPINYGELACILYTSGTTGIPKGIKITKKSIINLSEYCTRNYGLTAVDVFGLFSSIGFDAAYKAIFASIYSGACLDVIPGDVRLNMGLLNDYLIKQGINYVDITTQVAKLFIGQIENIPLDVLFTGGEKLGEFDGNVNCRFVDGYGPTEAYVEVACVDVCDKIDSSSVGHLVDNAKAYVLDDEFRRVPYGAVGELYLAGYQIAEGYLNREKENNDLFIDNPFECNGDYAVLYRTGDMVRVLKDGTLGIVGRRDDQVKIRGNRVELSEIESVIRELSYIKDVTLQTVKNGTNNELVAYVVVEGEVENINDLLCDYVAEHKPDYMVPSYVVELDEVPLNVNGKVDKKALPDVDLDALRTEYVAPTNEMQKVIVDAFEVVFNQKGIGLNDDFIRLGGDSITAIRLISLLEKNNISCAARDILNHKTPYFIGQNVESLSKISYEATVGEIDLLPIQSYFFNQVNSDDYSLKFVLKSNVDLDLDILQRAFDELSNVHDMLRANYKGDGENVRQEILPLNSCVCKIDEYDADDLNSAIGDVINKSKKSLDINGELIKITLVHYNDECYVVIVIHHLIIDGVSWSILIDDLTYIYKQLKENKEINLLRPYPYKNWVEDVQSLVEDISDGEKQYWIEINDLLDDSSIKGKSKTYNFNVDMNYDVDNLLMLSEEEYWALAIARAYKNTFGKDIIFNRESYGRDESLADLSKSIGWFTTQFPVPVDVNVGYDDISLMKDVYSLKTSFKCVKHLGLNYGSLVYISNELEYKHCPITFNFLSSEFSFKNELFESINEDLFNVNDNGWDEDLITYGISFNVIRMGSSYAVAGDYAEGTYLADKFDEFIENVKNELDYLDNYKFDNIVCCMSEPELGIYLDEKVNDKGSAYTASGIYECESDKSVDEIKDAIYTLIDKHPVLKARVVDGDIPLLVCDANPLVEVADVDDYSDLIRSFDLNEYLARFYIIDNDKSKSIFYDVHHLINDATSCNLINEDLSNIFNGNFDDNIDLGFVYSGYDSFDSKFENSYEKAYDFFNRNLSDMDEVNPLLHDNSGRNNMISLPVHDIRNEVEEFCRKSNITVGNFLNAVFAYTCSRFTGSSKVYYNFTEHGRHETYNQKSLGMYVNTIPIIVDCSNTSVDEYLSDVSDLILDSMSSSVYPFRLLAGDFDLNTTIGFEYNYDLNDVADVADELIIEDVSVELISEFVCVVMDLTDGYLLSIESCENYSDEMVIRFLNVFKEILVQMINKKMLCDIDYIANDDINLLNNFNQTEMSLKYGDILDAFNDNLLKYPDNKLVTYKDVSYTYSEGAFIADKIAKQLIDLGVESKDCVAFLTQRSEDYMFAALGIMACGAAYVPLDDAHPDERIQFILKDTQSKVVIVSDETYGRIDNLSVDIAVLNISVIKEDIGTLSSLTHVYGDLACILYTSGTTGLPKGVKITRKAVLNASSSYVDRYGITNGDVYGLYASIGFDVASLGLCQTIYSGACLSIVPEDIKLNMAELNNYFSSQKISYTAITAQVAKLFMGDFSSGESLKVLSVGGEKLGDIKNPDNYLVMDEYGPTEAFAFVSSMNYSDKIDSSSVGNLNHNTKAYVLDDEKRRVPCGAVGELYLAGYQIADGYLNREKETAEAFIHNPFDEGKYNMLYRTGDMVRILPDGSIGIVGRRDNQVKIRGNRVELSEIESVVRELSYIKDVTIQTVKNGTNNELIAYIVLKDGFDEECIEDYLRDYVAEHKPDYMVPSYVIGLDKIPLNVNGKVDKNALPDVDLDSLHAEFVAATNETEQTIVEAFEKVFNQKIGIYDDFVKLGGDSLTAIKVISLIDMDINPTAIFKGRTPYGIAQNIGQKEYGFDLVKKGNKNQNMFLLPPVGGLSFVFMDLVNNIDFDGNIYLIDDFKYDLSLDELKSIKSNDITFNHYYEAIKDIFQSGDIIVGFSLGCIYASLLCEKLEQNKQVAKCILIDGTLKFINDEEISTDDLIKEYGEVEYNEIINNRSGEFKDKFIEILRINSNWNFHTPKIECPVTYLATSDVFKGDLDKISDNHKFVLIDSNHKDILHKDIDKIIKYFK